MSATLVWERLFQTARVRATLGPYASGVGKVIWVIGAQKVVRDPDEVLRRVCEYALPLEDARACGDRPGEQYQ